MQHTNGTSTQRTRLRVEGDLVGRIRPIKSQLRRFGTVEHIALKNAPIGTAFFAVVHSSSSDPLDMLNSVLGLKGVDNVVFD